MRAILYLSEETPRFIPYPNSATGNEAFVLACRQNHANCTPFQTFKMKDRQARTIWHPLETYFGDAKR